MSTLLAVPTIYTKLITAWDAASSNALVNADDERVRDRQQHGLAGCAKMCWGFARNCDQISGDDYPYLLTKGVIQMGKDCFGIAHQLKAIAYLQTIQHIVNMSADSAI